MHGKIQQIKWFKKYYQIVVGKNEDGTQKPSRKFTRQVYTHPKFPNRVLVKYTAVYSPGRQRRGG